MKKNLGVLILILLSLLIVSCDSDVKELIVQENTKGILTKNGNNIVLVAGDKYLETDSFTIWPIEVNFSTKGLKTQEKMDSLLLKYKEETKRIEKITSKILAQHKLDYDACVKKYGKEYADDITKQKRDISTRTIELYEFQTTLIKAKSKLKTQGIENLLSSNKEDIEKLNKRQKELTYD